MLLSRKYSPAILLGMNTGISLDETCRMHVLSEEDFASMCNADGSVKQQPGTTTFSLKDDPSKSTTIDNTALYSFGVVIMIAIACIVVFFIKRRNKK